MPVKSYLAYPMTDRRQDLVDALASIDSCEVLPSSNYDLVILVTDTPDEETEAKLEKTLKEIPSLQCLAFVSGFPENEAATEVQADESR